PCRRPHTAVVDLVHVFPARYPKRTANGVETILVRIQGGAFETHVETHGTALSALGFVFQALDPFEPVVAVVVRIDKGNIMFRSETYVLVLAYFIFPIRMNVGIVEINRVVDTRGCHGLHDFTGTRS